MTTQVRLPIVVVCLGTVVACFFGWRQSVRVDVARPAEVPTIDHRVGSANGRNYRQPVDPAATGIPNSLLDAAIERTPSNAVDDDPSRANETEAFEEFDRWIDEYSTAESRIDLSALDRRGETLALARRPALARLIESDPERALGRAVPMKIRQELPASVVRHLEERVSGLARYDVIASLGTYGQPRSRPAIERFVTINDRTFKAFVYGRRAFQTSKEAIPLHGIAVGNAFAVHESPVRVLEPGEVPDPSFPVANADGRCPISKLAAGSAVAVEVGGTIFHLCHAGHIETFNQEVEAQEAGIGPRSRASVELPGAATWTRGAKSVLFMRVNFPDDSGEPISEVDAYEMMRQVNEFFVENSYGATSLAATVTPLLTLPATKAWYATNDAFATLLAHARAAAAAAGYDIDSFHLDCVHLKPVFSSSLGYVGTKGAWLEDRSPMTACHEFGHNLGLWHANAWRTSDGSVIGTGSNSEYGNVFDTMGGGAQVSGQFNACHKHGLGWLPDDAVQTITSDGVYRLQALDVSNLTDGLTYALRIPKDGQRNYWIETRQALAANPVFSGSVLINWSPWTLSDGGSQLLDTTPRSEGGFFDAPLLMGRSFYDPSIGLKIVPLNLGGTTPESVDLLVTHVHCLTVEAEEGTLTSPAGVFEDPLASHNQYIAFPVSNQGGVAWTLDIPAAGEYTIWCRVRQDQSGAAPFSVSVDGESEPLNAVWEGPGAGGWRWSRLIEWPPQTTRGITPKLLMLTAGTHTIRVAGGEGNSKLDTLVFTDDPAINPPSFIPSIADQVTVAGRPGISIPFTIVGIGTPLSVLTLTSRSSNPVLVPETNIVFEGGDLNRTVTITPAPDQLGTVSITLTVTDPNGNQMAATFSLTVIGAIQGLVNAALPGDTVTVPAGTYTDHVIIDKDLVLQGAGAVTTVIDGRYVGVPLTIRSNASVTIRNLTLRHGNAGGLRNHGSAKLDGCAVCDNRAAVDGGGIWNGDTASLVLQNCTVSGNRCSSSDGGGIYNMGMLTAHTITVSGNRSASKDEKGNGGGIFNANTLELHNSTIVGNKAASNGGGVANIGTATLHSTIVAMNSVSLGEGPDCYGTLTSAGCNLLQAPDGCSLIGDTTRDVVGQNPRLGPLQDNGGPTLTHALLADSPAIDHGETGGVTIDQRGVGRPFDVPGVANSNDACDIGSYEWIPENVRALRASLTTGATPKTLSVRIILVARGDENSVEFNLVYPAAFLHNPRLALGMDAHEAAMTGGDDSEGLGRLSVRVILPAGKVFSVGVRDLLTIEFDSVREVTNRNVSGIEFDAVGGACSIRGAVSDELSAVYSVSSPSLEVGPSLAIRRQLNGDVTVKLTGGSGRNWTIQASADLVIWRTVATIEVRTSVEEIIDLFAHQYPSLIYRAISD